MFPSPAGDAGLHRDVLLLLGGGRWQGRGADERGQGVQVRGPALHQAHLAEPLVRYRARAHRLIQLQLLLKSACLVWDYVVLGLVFCSFTSNTRWNVN